MTVLCAIDDPSLRPVWWAILGVLVGIIAIVMIVTAFLRRRENRAERAEGQKNGGKGTIPQEAFRSPYVPLTEDELSSGSTEDEADEVITASETTDPDERAEEPRALIGADRDDEDDAGTTRD